MSVLGMIKEPQGSQSGCGRNVSLRDRGALKVWYVMPAFTNGGKGGRKMVLGRRVTYLIYVFGEGACMSQVSPLGAITVV